MLARTTALGTILLLMAVVAPGDPLESCASTSAPGRELAQCIYEAAGAGQSWEAVGRELEALASRRPDDPWPPLYLGHVSFFIRRERAGELYRRAIAIADREQLPAAAIEARVGRVRQLSSEGRREEAAAVLTEALELARELGDRQLLAKVRIREASQLLDRGEDLDFVEQKLEEVERDVWPAGPSDLKKEWLVAAIRVHDVLGHHPEVRALVDRGLGLAENTDDRRFSSWLKFVLAVNHVNAEMPGPRTRERARALYRDALAAARAAEHPVEGLIRLELGKLVGGEEGRQHLTACLEMARARSDPLLTSWCEGALAANALSTDPGQAGRRLDQLLESARSSTDPWLMVYGWEERFPVYWGTLPPEEALQRSLDVLESLETLRETQISGAARAGLLDARAGPYYWLSGRLLAGEDGTATPRARLEQAFHLIERMRARVLLETLEASLAARLPPADDPARVELDEVLARKVDVQRRLLEPRRTPVERSAAIAALEEVENEEAAVRRRLAEIYPRYAELKPRDFATLDDVERSLGHGEALLSYQLAFDEDVYGRFGGGSWLIVSTRDGSRSYRQPDRARLEPRIDPLLGLADPGAATPALVRLHEELLAPALADLPPAVDRLVIVPDQGLHRLPFALLQPAEDGPPLISRYRLSISPSATLWLRWRARGPGGAPAEGGAPDAVETSPVLVFADPLVQPSAARQAPARTRQGSPTYVDPLAPLPHARAEGEAIVRILGDGSRLMVGAEASENLLKATDLRRFHVLHFAAHAVVNGEVPERSAVFLAEGGENDGWLQPAEIAELDLDGRLVVLASCDTAAGQVLRGEGVMSLARSFFHAGSPAVVASLWPLPDEESSKLFEEFYRRLARGSSLDDALAGAQRTMIRRGAPARAWAGVMVLGDGAAAPFPGGLDSPAPMWTIVVAILLLLAAVAWFRGRSRRRPGGGILGEWG